LRSLNVIQCVSYLLCIQEEQVFQHASLGMDQSAGHWSDHDSHDQSVSFLLFGWLQVDMSLPALCYVTVSHLLDLSASKRSESPRSSSKITVSWRALS
jgi:hypothetical protein